MASLGRLRLANEGSTWQHMNMTCRTRIAILQGLVDVLFALGVTSACAAGNDFNVVPLKQKAVGAGNTEIRVVYIGSLGIESSMLLFERTARENS